MAADDKNGKQRARADRRTQRSVEDIAAEYADRLVTGEKIDAEEILEAHPELGPELLEHLELFAAMRPSSEAEPLGSLGDYTLRRQIGRGGMGVVYDAWQHSLDRQVALKVLPAGIAADDKAFHRFMREAKTAAKLHHPNVVGVYGMGVESDTPYYSMEFVEGDTLAQILGRLRSLGESDSAAERKKALSNLVELLEKGGHGSTSTSEPVTADSRTLDLEGDGVAPSASSSSAAKEITPVYCYRLAEAFAAAAEGLQHAHANGVVHRDIKPSNLILDGEGRLRLLDFGLARLEGQESLTVSGDLLGTVQYMSPEQAMARRIPIDHRTDIYSLGATLYEMLTFRPPFEGKNYQDTLSKIVLRDPQAPRRLNPRIPADLETIVLKCLRKDASERYGTAEALAQDLHRFVRGDAIEARPQPVLEKLVRWTWRRRGRLAAVSCAVLFLLSVGLLLHNEWAEYRQKALALYSDQVLSAVASIERGRASYEAATGHTRGGRSPGTSSMEPPLALTERVGDAVREAVAALEEASRRFPRRPEAHYHLAQAYRVLGNDAGARSRLRKALECDESFVPALIAESTILEEAGDAQQARSRLERAEGVAGSEWTAAWLEIQNAEKKRDWKRAIAAYRSLDSVEGSGFLGFSLRARLGCGRARLGAKDYVGALVDFSIAHERWPQLETPVLLSGKAYYLLGDATRAEEFFAELARDSTASDEVSLRIAQVYFEVDDYGKSLEWTDKATLSAHREVQRGKALALQDDYEAAIRACEQAIELDAESYGAHYWLGFAHQKMQAVERAAAAYKRAIELDPDAAWPCHNLAILYMDDMGRLAEAEALAREAVQRATNEGQHYAVLVSALRKQGKREEALAVATRGCELAPFSSWAHSCRGTALSELKRYEDALVAFQTAVELDPRASLHNDLGICLDHLGRAEEAQRHIREAIALDPNNGSFCLNLSISLNDSGKRDERVKVFEELRKRYPKSPGVAVGLGNVLTGQNQHREAIQLFREAIELDPEAVEPYTSLATALAHESEFDEAVDACKKAIGLRPNDASLHYRLGRILTRAGKLDEAVRAYEKTMELDRSNGAAHLRVGEIYQRQGRREQALDAYRKALELGVGPALRYGQLGEAFREIGQLEEAAESFREAIRVLPYDSSGYNGFVRALQDLDRAEEAFEETQKILERHPKVAAAHFGLGIALYSQYAYAKAIPVLRRALELDPSDWQFYFFLGHALAEEGELGQAAAVFRQGLEHGSDAGDKAQLYQPLGRAEWAQGNLKEAVTAFREAARLDPQNKATQKLLEEAEQALRKSSKRLLRPRTNES